MATRGTRRLKPISARPTPSIVADRIRAAIVAGAFQPGSQLAEKTLAEQLGISRGPVREAFQRLTQEGLVFNLPNRGVFVVDLSSDDVEDIYLARGAIESVAAVRLLSVDGGHGSGALRAIVRQMELAARARRWSDVVQQDLKFHTTLVSSSGSKRLVHMFNTLISETQMCLQGAGPLYTSYLEIAEEHRALLDAIESGNERLTRRRVREHMDRSSRLITSRLRGDADERGDTDV